MFSTENQPAAGRKGRGKSERTKLIDALKRNSKSEEDFYNMLIKRAFNPEDGFALKEVLQRMYPLKKAVAPNIEWDYSDGDSAYQSSLKIVTATAKGEIPPDVCKMMIDSISSMMKIEEITDLKGRIKNLESSVGINE